MIKDDTEVLAVCNVTTAQHLLATDTTGHISDALVITSVLEDDEIVVVPRDEFLYILIIREKIIEKKKICQINMLH